MSTIKLGSTNGNTLIAAFDLDWTLIRSPKGLFPKDENDWKWLPLRLQRLKTIETTGYAIVIITNQKSKGARRTTLSNRLHNIYASLKEHIDNLIILASFEDDEFRKPNIGMLNLLDFAPKEGSFYCGDADGSPLSYADTGRAFALKANLPFISVHDTKMFPSYFVDRSIKLDPAKVLVMMIGAPKTGKKTLVKKHFQGWKVVKTLPEAKRTLDEGKGLVVIGKATKEERKPYLDQAREAGYRIIIMMICRDGHSLAKGSPPDIAYHGWFKRLEEPSEAEGQVVEIW
jgi:DNA 3'-phosphatase